MRDKQKQTKRHPRYYDERFFAEAEGFTMIPRSQAPPDPNMARFASDTWTIEHAPEEPVRKARKYLRAGQQAPAGHLEKKGPKGGRYYETEARAGAAPEQTGRGAPDQAPGGPRGAPKDPHAWARAPAKREEDVYGRTPDEIRYDRISNLDEDEYDRELETRDIPINLRRDLLGSITPIRRYCGFGYQAMKAAVRPRYGRPTRYDTQGMRCYVDPASREGERQLVEQIEELMEPLIESHELFHGLMRLNDKGESPLGVDLAGVKPGDVLSDFALTSWSENPWTAYQFSGRGKEENHDIDGKPYVLHIKDAKGMRGIYVGGGEYETILPHGQKYKVTSVDEVHVDPDAGIDPYAQRLKEYNVADTWHVITIEAVPGTDHEPVPHDDWTHCEAGGIHWDLTRTGVPCFDEELIDGSYHYTGSLIWIHPKDMEELEMKASAVMKPDAWMDTTYGPVLTREAEAGYERMIDNDKVHALMQAFEDPDNTWKPFVIELDENGAIADYQEGRHRARALRWISENGLPKMMVPVWVFKRKKHPGRNTGDQPPDYDDFTGRMKINHWNRIPNDDVTIVKAKKYLPLGHTAPAGYPVKRGPRGGYYYETKSRAGKEGPPAKGPEPKRFTPEEINNIIFFDGHRGSRAHPELNYLHGQRLGPGIIHTDERMPPDWVWFVHRDGKLRWCSKDEFEYRTREDKKAADREERLTKKRGSPPHTPEELTQILSLPPSQRKARPDLRYLDQEEVGPNVWMEGEGRIPENYIWFVEKNGSITIAHPDQKRELLAERRKKELDARVLQNILAETRVEHHVDEYIPYDTDWSERVTYTGILSAVNDFETASCFSIGDPDPLWEHSGDKNHVSFTRDELGQLPGTLLIHNHPSGNSFSDQDIFMACNYEIREMRVSSGIRDEEYVMLPPEGHFCFYPELWDQIQPAYEDAIDQTRTLLMGKIQSGEISPEEANYRHFHNVWTLVAEKTGVRYMKRAITKTGRVVEGNND